MLLALLATPREGGSGLSVFFIQITAIFAIFYFLLIRPQQKERQRHDQMIKALGKGDEIVTSGGIVGTIVHAEESQITIKSGDTKLVIQRAAVQRRVDPTAADDAA